MARYLCDRLGKESFEVLPHVSSMQLAFARVKESWEDAYLTNLAGRPIEAVIDRIRTAEKVGLFSSDELPPPRLARELLDRGIDYFRAYVCENLGSPDERVTQAELADLCRDGIQPAQRADPGPQAEPARPGEPGQPAPPLRQPRRRLRPDAAQAGADHPGGGPGHRPGPARHPRHQHGLGHRGRLGLGGDRGRAARPPGVVYAIEPEPADIALIQANAESFGVPNVRTVLGRAPEVLAGLPEPDAVFVGGTGRQADLVLSTAYGRLCPGGSLAVNVATIEGLASAYHTLKALAGEVRVWNVVDRARDRADGPPAVRGGGADIPAGGHQAGCRR